MQNHLGGKRIYTVKKHMTHHTICFCCSYCWFYIWTSFILHLNLFSIHLKHVTSTFVDSLFQFNWFMLIVELLFRSLDGTMQEFKFNVTVEIRKQFHRRKKNTHTINSIFLWTNMMKMFDFYNPTQQINLFSPIGKIR